MYVFHCCWLYRQEAEREGKRRLKPQGDTGTALLLPLATLTFYTEESILRPNTLSIFTLPLTARALCALTCTFSCSSSSICPPPLSPSCVFFYPLGDSCMQKHCGSVSFKTPSLKIAPLLQCFSETQSGTGGLMCEHNSCLWLDVCVSERIKIWGLNANLLHQYIFNDKCKTCQTLTAVQTLRHPSWIFSRPVEVCGGGGDWMRLHYGSIPVQWAWSRSLEAPGIPPLHQTPGPSINQLEGRIA